MIGANKCIGGPIVIHLVAHLRIPFYVELRLVSPAKRISFIAWYWVSKRGPKSLDEAAVENVSHWITRKTFRKKSEIWLLLILLTVYKLGEVWKWNSLKCDVGPLVNPALFSQKELHQGLRRDHIVGLPQTTAASKTRTLWSLIVPIGK